MGEGVRLAFEHIRVRKNGKDQVLSDLKVHLINTADVSHITSSTQLQEFGHDRHGLGCFVLGLDAKTLLLNNDPSWFLLAVFWLCILY